MKNERKAKGFRRFRAGLNQFKYEKLKENYVFRRFRASLNQHVVPFVFGMLLSGTPDEKPWFRVVASRYSEPWAPVEEGSRILVRLHSISLD